MKPQASTTLYRTGNLPDAEVHTMRVATDAAAVQALQDNLSNLYTHKERAAVREVLTNSNDAHRRAGHTEPVRVTLDRDGQFICSDHGVGMSKQELLDLFGTYGASSKRGSDEQQGMMGFGAKAPFALVDEFHVATVKGGKRNVVICRRNPDRANELVFIQSDVPTDSPSGTTVSFTAPNHYDMRQAVTDVLKYWREEDGYTYTYNGEPQCFTAGPGVDGEDDVWRAAPPDFDAGIVQGGVHYPFTSNSTGYVFFVPVGSVDFTPSREGLKMTERTEEVLDAIDYWHECRPKPPKVSQQFSSFRDGQVYYSQNGGTAAKMYNLWASEAVTHIVCDVSIQQVNRHHTRWFPNDNVLWISAKAWRCEMWARERWPGATMETYAEAKAANRSSGGGSGSRPIMYGNLTLAEARETPNLCVLDQYEMPPESFLRGKTVIRLSKQQKMSTARKRLPDAIFWSDYSQQCQQAQRFLASLTPYRGPVYLTEHALVVAQYDRKWYWRIGLNWHRAQRVADWDHLVNKRLDETIKSEYPVLEYLQPGTPTEIIDLMIRATKETSTS